MGNHQNDSEMPLEPAPFRFKTDDSEFCNRRLLSGCVTVLVLVLFSARLIWLHCNRPAHSEDIATAYGSIGLIYGGAQASHDGRQFIYVGTSAKGFALFLFDIATNHKTIVFEENHPDSTLTEYFNDLKAFPWAPDDSAFAYFAHGRLIIHPSTGEPDSTWLTIGAAAPTDLAWLNPAEFAFILGNTRLYDAQKDAHGEWSVHELWKGGSGMSSLTAISTKALSWLQDGFICRIDLTNEINGKYSFGAAAPGTNAAPPTEGLALWLDASTLRQGDQTSVEGLSDLSSNKNDAVANGGAPVYNAPQNPLGLNGKGTIHFASETYTPEATGLKTINPLGIVGSAPRTVFAVMRRDAGRQVLINIGEFGKYGGFFGLCDQNKYLFLPSGFFPESGADRTTPLADTWNVFDVVYDGSSEKGYVNGILKQDSELPINTIDNNVEIGTRSPNSKGRYAASSDGDFAELLVYNRAFDPEERQQVENYLSRKWFGSDLLSPQNPIVWLDPRVSGTTGLSYSKENGQFIITSHDLDGDSLWLFDPGMKQSSQIVQSYSIHGAQWVDSSTIAYAAVDYGNRSVILADPSGVKKDTLLKDVYLNWFQIAPDGKNLFFEAAISNQPQAGIWQFDLASKRLESVVSCSDDSFAYAQNITPSRGTVRLPTGGLLDYIIYTPPGFNPRSHKKYPILIGNTWFGNGYQTAYDRFWAPAVANCGAFVVIVQRAEWWKDIDQWPDNIQSVYHVMIQNPYVDAHRVFIVAVSAETQYVHECIAKSPGLCSGVILLNPSGLPDFSNLPRRWQRPKVLISAGEAENEADKFEHYQIDELRNGVLTQVMIHRGEGHHLTGSNSLVERTKAMIDFIFDQ